MSTTSPTTPRNQQRSAPLMEGCWSTSSATAPPPASLRVCFVSSTPAQSIDLSPFRALSSGACGLQRFPRTRFKPTAKGSNDPCLSFLPLSSHLNILHPSFPNHFMYLYSHLPCLSFWFFFMLFYSPWGGLFVWSVHLHQARHFRFAIYTVYSRITLSPIY